MPKIDSSFKFEDGRKYYETPNSWAKVRIMKDPRKGDYYIDVLMGSKGDKKPHVHFGINGDQSYRFLEPRGSLHTLNRKAVGSDGFNSDETLVLDSVPGRHRFRFTVLIEERTRTIKVLFSDAVLL